MQILVLNNDLMERTVIQQVLQHNGHEILPAEDSDTAMQLLQEGGIRFVIADRTTTDIEEKQFIRRVREANPPYYIYILLITSKVQDLEAVELHSGADDFLHKPIIPFDLKSRVQIAERIIALRDSLTQAKNALEDAALFDPLTNLLNPKAFLALGKGELERARRSQAPLSLIALKVDNLQDIKRQYGEDVGKDVVVLIAQAMREKSRPYDGIGHYQEDTFLIPLPGVIGQDAEKIADRILKGILNADISLLNGTPIPVAVRAGIISTLRVPVSMEIEMLIEKALEALSHAQQTAEDRVFTIFL
ncbi:MAG TPA: diguanylate cyclase [Anaerolineales bacterium]|nr:diguanylate cyclase [Anaerolineales bacterium]